MDDAVLVQLRRALSECGPRVHRDPHLAQAVLLDLCDSGKHRREIAALVAAVSAQVPRRLLQARRAELHTTLGERLARQLFENMALDQEAAHWAVRTWASALRLSGLRLSYPDSSAGPEQEPAQRIARLANRILGIARSLPKQNSRAAALGMAATVLAATDADQASQVVDEAEQLLKSISSDHLRTCQTHDLAVAVAGYDPGRAEHLASSVQGLMKDHALRCLVAVLASSDLDGARQMAGRIGHEHLRMSALAAVVADMARTDPPGAAGLARSLTGEYWQAEALCQVATAVTAADSGRFSRLAGEAEYLARQVSDAPVQAAALGSVARTLAASGSGRAAALFAEAEDIARSADDQATAESALGSLAIAMADSDPDRALSLAGTLTEGWYARGEIARILAGTDPERAFSIARSLPQETPQLVDIAVAMTAADAQLAQRLAGSIPVGRWKASALAGVARALARTEPDRAEMLLDDVERLAEQELTDDLDKVIALADVAAAWDADR
jgi:hypothetical protein